MTETHLPDPETFQDDEAYVFPTSFAQQRLWFLEQLVPGLPVYSIPGAVRIRGALDPAVLERSLNEIVQRHESLRTTFIEVEGEPVQVIRPALTLVLPVVDVTEAHAPRYVRDEAARSFDLAQGPLLRAVLLRLAPTDHILVVTMHHIISDGWSLGVFVREIAMLWEALAHGRPSPLPELPIQYADFAVWQREHLQGETLDAQIRYWKAQLAGAPTLLELPTDRPRPAVQTFVGAKVTWNLSAKMLAALKALGREVDASLFMTLLAAFDVLLYRLTGQKDIVVGSPIANRNRPELEPLIGFFVNTLALRSDLSGNPTFRELLCRVRETTLEAYAHEELPFEKLVEELQPERSLSHTPLFQVAFTLQSQTVPVIDSPGISIRPYELESNAVKFDLTLELYESEGGLEAILDYNRDLFTAETAERILARYELLLERILAAPETPLSELSIVTETERHFLIEELNCTASDYPRVPIHQLFAAQVDRIPDAIAVRHGAATLTYRQLDEQSNRLAHALIARGVRSGTLVGLCLERGLDLIVGVLGILKAGGAYVPLDADYPQARLRFMLEDAQLPVLITQATLAERFAGYTGAVVLIDTHQDKLAHQSTRPSVNVMTDQPICVFYTSGSTGRPKGIVIPHRAVSRLLFNTNYITLGPDERIGQIASTAFDAFTFEMWGALLHGGTLVIIERDITLVPRDLALEIRNQGITSLFLTTALFNQIVQEVPQTFAGLCNVFVGGEAVTPRWLRTALHQGAPQRLANLYGPTESTTFACWYLVEDVSEAATTVPIGWAIANTQLYILDSDLYPVPIGVPGELYIGGDGLALGYLHRPALTAERFVPDPFGASGARLYRTGDVARYRPDGAIDFIGRVDFQVKIRGLRIELGEIETTLAQHPAIKEALVLVREDVPDDKRLVAYFVPAQQPAPPMRQLRAFLREQLPDYMIPTAFVILEAFPLTPNGKVDREALPAPERGSTSADFVAPRTPTEQAIAGIFGTLLNVPQVSVSDNFFALGGHSLLATQVMSRIREHFEVEIPLRALFETPTVEGLAQAVVTAQTQRASAPPVARIEAVERGDKDLADLLDDLL